MAIVQEDSEWTIAAGILQKHDEQFARALGRIALNGHRIDGVVPADENVDALYEYLIGGE